MDRGRLWHVKETTYQVFCALEEDTQPHVDKLCLLTSAGTVRNEFLYKIVESDDVQFYWCIAATGFEIEDTDVHNLLLRLIADLYLTI